jgi:hypothetical protein
VKPAPRYLIRGERIYHHDGDIHQPATADLLIRGGIIIPYMRKGRQAANIGAWP